MTEKRARKPRIGRPIKHGAHALIYRDEVIKQYPELVKYTRDAYDGLVYDLAPEGIETLSTAKRIILERLTAKLLTAGLLDIFMGEHGVLRRDPLNRQIPEAEPIVGTWLQVNHAILRDLMALGLEPKKLEPKALTPAELLEAAGDEAVERARAHAAAQDGRSGKGEEEGSGEDAPCRIRALTPGGDE